ncbi:MAG TPA: ComEC/Rec2 family competence protein [Bacteroidales bacterium]|nr:ComEC/Rec2 family competence protein [Bacteroidales bacterium]
MLNREIPFFRIIIPLGVGIVSGLWFTPGHSFLITASITLITGFAASLFFNRNPANVLFGIVMEMSLYTCGLLLFTNEKKSLSKLEEIPRIYNGTITDYPEEKANSIKIILKLNSVRSGSKPEPVRGSVVVYLSNDNIKRSFLPGDLLKIRLTPLPIVNRGNPYEFDYRFYMENLGIKYSAYASPDDVSGSAGPHRRPLRYRALIVRERIIDMYRERGITGERLALVAAMTLGQKKMLEPQQKQIFIKAGVMHIMAVSGLHAMILSLFISHLLFFLKGKLKPLRVIITILLLWSFAFVTGLTPSVMRAALMFSFIETGKLIRRNVNNINSVLASAFVLIIIRPSVIFDAGFLLSYSAVLFIICFYNELYHKICFKTYFADKIWQSAVVTIVAQAGTLPLTISLFNRFPLWFILSNIAIVPLSSLLIIIGCLVPLTYPLKFISGPLAWLLGRLTGFTEMLTETISKLPFSSIENIGMTGFEAFLLFIAIITTGFWLTDRKRIRAVVPLLTILVFVTATGVLDISRKRSAEIIVYNTISSHVIGVRTGKRIYVYGNNPETEADVSRHCATARLKIIPMTLTNEISAIKAGDCRILVSNRISNRVIDEFKPGYIILTGKYPAIEGQVNTEKISSLVLAPDVSDYFSIPEKTRIKGSVHIVRKAGAFRVAL